jgi:hypothetical protein
VLVGAYVMHAAGWNYVARQRMSDGLVQIIQVSLDHVLCELSAVIEKIYGLCQRERKVIILAADHINSDAYTYR